MPLSARGELSVRRAAEVRDALTFFCIDQKIPVPSANLEKSLHLLGDALAMVISDRETVEPRKQAVLNHIYHHQLRNLG